MCCSCSTRALTSTLLSRRIHEASSNSQTPDTTEGKRRRQEVELKDRLEHAGAQLHTKLPTMSDMKTYLAAK
jgi:hypothetical protein